MVGLLTFQLEDETVMYQHLHIEREAMHKMEMALHHQLSMNTQIVEQRSGLIPEP